MSPDAEVTSLEKRLAAFAGRNDALLVGHANTGLFLALKYLGEKRGFGEVIVSAIVCPSLIQTIINAGFVPVYADVKLPLCTVDPDAVAKAIGPNTRAIVAIHIFGHSADMVALSALARRHEVWLIEDAAQSIGGVISGRRHGGWGDISLYSFGGSKIISAGAGGALLCEDPAIASHIRCELPHLPPLTFDSSYMLLAQSHRNLIHGMMDALRVNRNALVWRSLADMLDVYRPLYLHAFPSDNRFARNIAQGLDRFDEELRERQRRALAYWSGLNDLAPMLQVPDKAVCSGTVWRFTSIIADPALAIRATMALRNAGFHASNHYWSVAELLQGKRDLPNTDYVSPRLLNLWVEPSVDMKDIDRTIDVLRRALQG